MKAKRLALLIGIALLLTIFIVSPALSATSASIAISPVSLSTNYGSTNGLAAVLANLEQNGVEDDPSAYVLYATSSSTPYVGYSVFQLPPQVRADRISSAILQVNFNGPAHTQQLWTWSIYNWTTGQWNKLGDTIGANANVWDMLIFRITGFARYVSSHDEVRIQLTSNNSDGDVKIDYQALHFTFIPVTPTATRSTGTPAATKPAYTYANTYTPTATFTPTNTPTATSTPTATPTVPSAPMPAINISTFKSGFSAPIFITHANDGTDRIFVVERCGTVKIINSSGTVLSTPFLDLTTGGTSFTCASGEQGLLSIAFPPNYASKRYFYAAYTISNRALRVARFHVDPGTPNVATTSGHEIIIDVPHPDDTNHNGGQLAFGSDGYLYISTGDGGGANDTNNDAQNPNNLLGKVLRIHVEGGALTYSIPASNPFVGVNGLDEIWALGLRNPWRFSFDRSTHNLYIADVGQGGWEEVNVQPASSSGGENYGWHCYEGNHAFDTAGCQAQNFYDAPVVEYSHSLGCSVTGGYVYRGSEFSSLQGIYFYGDYCTGRIWGLRNLSGQWQSQMLLDTSQRIASFGEDEAGNVYFADIANGTIYKVIDPAASQTGSYSLRFYGHGSGDIDRVKVKLDAPAVPADIGANFTLEFWMKANAADNGTTACVPGGVNWINGNVIFDRDVYGSGDHGDYGISLANGKIAFGVAQGSTEDTICGTTTVADGTWHHIAVTRNTTNGAMNIFVDGTLDASGTGPTGDISYRDGRTTSYSNSDPYLVLGAEKHDAGAEYPSYNGYLDEVRLSNNIRYTSNFTRPATPFASDANTVALYHFDEGPAGNCTSTILDSSFTGTSDGVCQNGGAAPAGPVYSTSVPSLSPSIAGCPMFPSNNIWNARVDSLAVHARSAQWINSIGSNDSFHMDFGSGTWNGGAIGIPYNIVAGSTVTKYSVDFYYPDESDAGPYPIPGNPTMEYGSDHHILVVDTETCTLYETYDMSFSGGQWSGGSGAIWNLNSNALRPDTWTSADAAGLPILPGLVRYEEVAAGYINHAIRFTAQSTNSYIWPARHLTSGTAGVLTNTPPMGARFRLKASFDISGFSPEMQVILRAMKEYGIILADNGSDWYISGAPSESWDNDMLHTLDVLKGSDFEAVDTSGLIVNVNSGQVTP